MNHFLPALLTVPVLLPLAGAGLALIVGRKPSAQRFIACAVLVATTVVSAFLVVGAGSGPIVLDVGSWSAPIGVTLVADRLSAVMLLVSQFVTLAVLVYSLKQSLIDDDPHTPVAVYFPTFLILSAGVSNAFLTGDLFNLFVGFEILLAASFVLITLGATRGRVRAGTVYVVVSLVSSAIFLAGIALTYAATGTVNIAQLAVRLPQIDHGVATLIHLVLLIAFGIKAALVPLHAWLPDSYPTAPGPVTAVFAGLMTKVGVYALIRLEVLLFPGDDLSWVLTPMAMATMLVGILGAVAQDDVKRLLSFVLVSHIGYMVWGLSLTSELGLAATIHYAAHHILVQTCLFLMVALVERRTGTTSLSRLHSLARTSPTLAVVFLVAALNLVGVPPLTGFVGKFGFVRASVERGTPEGWLLLAGGMITSLLTLYVVTKWWNLAFWQGADEERIFMDPAVARTSTGRRGHVRAQSQAQRARDILLPLMRRGQALSQQSRTAVESAATGSSWIMYAVVLVLVFAQVGMAFFSGPVWNYVSAAARDQLTLRTYVGAVLGSDGRGSGSSVDESGGSKAVIPVPDPRANPTHEDDRAESGVPHGQSEEPPSGSVQSGEAPSSGHEERNEGEGR